MKTKLFIFAALFGALFMLQSCKDDETASCSDGVKNQDEISVDCGGVCSACAPDTQTFLISGTWLKPEGATSIKVICLGGGGGGASGEKAFHISNNDIRGGGGGGGGGLVQVTFLPAELPNSMPVTIGKGGVGGVAVSTDDTPSNAGATGEETIFGDTSGIAIIANGGFGGSWGQGNSGGSGEVIGYFGVSVIETGGGGGSSNWNSSTGGGTSQFAGPGGGGGGFANGSGNFPNGGNGGVTLANATGSGGAGGTSSETGTPTAGSNGLPNSVTQSGFAGQGGGGGGAAGAQDAAKGGDGGFPGAGGGGGGANAGNTGNSGAGGNGADGVVIVITYF